MKFPTILKENNEYKDQKDVVSYTYQFCPGDLDGKTFDEREFYLDEIAQALLNLKAESKKADFFKIYNVDGNIFLNTSHKDPLVPGVKITPAANLEGDLFGSHEFDSNIIISDDYCKINGRYYRFIRVSSFPESLFDMGIGDYLITFQKISKEESVKSLDRKRRLFRSDNATNFSNYTSQEAEAQSEELLSHIQLDQDAFYKVELWFLCVSDTEKELSQKTNEILIYLKSVNCKVLIEDRGLTESILNFIPGFVPNFLDYQTPPLSYLVGLLPLSVDKIHDEGLPLTSLSGYEVFWDNFSSSESLNYNIAISGTSGAGKTFFAQKLVNHCLSKGIKALIIDRGDSFLSLTKYHNGQIFNGKINPLQFKENIRFLTEFLTSFIPQEELSYKKRCLLYRTLKDIMKVQSPKSMHELLSLIDQKIDEFSLYFEELNNYFTCEENPITDITYVDTRTYPERFLRPLFIFLTEYIDKIKGRKLFVFEEMWHELDHNISYLSEFFRTSRSKGISCLAITQLFEDLVESKIGNVIAKTTCYKIFFSQDCKKSEFLDDYDIEEIQSLRSVRKQYSELYLKSPTHRKKLRNYSTALEHEIFTSNDLEKEEIKKFIQDHEKYHDYQTLIHRWTEMKYGHDNLDTPLVELKYNPGL